LVPPTGEFIRDFTVKYYERDYRASKQASLNFEILYRQQIIDEPARLKKDETVGPFYGQGMADKKLVVTHELENKQVYTFVRNKYAYRPGDGEKEDVKLQQMETPHIYKGPVQQIDAAGVPAHEFATVRAESVKQ